MINIPMWARAPKCKNGVKATDRGWVDAKTGELLRKVPNLLARVDEVKKQLAEEYQKEIDTLDSNFNSSEEDFNIDDIEKEIEADEDKQESAPEPPTSKEIFENAEGVAPEEAKKEIHDEFMNEITKRENVGPVVTTSIEQTITNADDANVKTEEEKTGAEPKAKRKYTKKAKVNNDEESKTKPKRKYTRRKNKDETNPG